MYTVFSSVNFLQNSHKIAQREGMLKCMLGEYDLNFTRVVVVLYAQLKQDLSMKLLGEINSVFQKPVKRCGSNHRQ